MAISASLSEKMARKPISYAMLGRQDHENISFMTSSDLYEWRGGSIWFFDNFARAQAPGNTTEAATQGCSMATTIWPCETSSST